MDRSAHIAAPEARRSVNPGSMLVMLIMLSVAPMAFAAAGLGEVERQAQRADARRLAIALDGLGAGWADLVVIERGASLVTSLAARPERPVRVSRERVGIETARVSDSWLGERERCNLPPPVR